MSVLGLPNYPRTALFIDGANLHSTTKACGYDIDYVVMLKMFRAETNCLRACYYTAISDEPDSLLRPLVDFLDYNGYRVVTKYAKEFTDSATGRRKLKGNMGIELAVDAMEYCEYVDHIYLFSGDGDFRALVESLQKKGKRVTVVSALAGGDSVKANIVADELRRQADEFINLNHDNPFTDCVHRRYRNDDERVNNDDGVARTLAPRPQLARVG